MKNMVLTRAPLRISFAGGGSDIPAYYENYGSGAVLNMAINKYVYCFTHKMYDEDKVRLHYKYTETVNADEFCTLEHDLIRCCMERMDITSGIEVLTVADVITRGSGLGSSSALAVSFLKNLSILDNRTEYDDLTLAKFASLIEINDVGASIGSQDHCAASCGGMNVFTFKKDGEIEQDSINLSEDLLSEFERHILAVNTGQCRDASRVLKSQIDNFGERNKALKEMVHLVPEAVKCLEQGDFDGVTKILDITWTLKASLSNSVSNEEIQWLYEFVKKYDRKRIGGKVCGAGGGGFVVFLVPPELKTRIVTDLAYNTSESYKCLYDIKLDREGVKCLYAN